MSKDDAQRRYDEAFAAHQDAFEQLLAARQELDEYIREEEAARHAVFLGFEEGDEEGIAMAKSLQQRRREQKEAAKAQAEARGDYDGPIGGVA